MQTDCKVIGRIRNGSSHAVCWLLLAALTPTLLSRPASADVSAAAYNPSVMSIPGGSAAGGASSSGQVSESYSFELPPAPLMPSIALSYSSGDGDSDVGYGWSLAAGSSIRRDTSREAPTLDARDDHYTLDGAPLIRVDSVDTEGSEHDVYEMWGDTSGTKVTLNKATNEWTATGLNGRVRKYGWLVSQSGTVIGSDGPVKLRRTGAMKTAESRTAWDKTVEWGLLEEEDAFGNRVEYFYNTWRPMPLGGTMPQYPTLREIRYGGNARTGVKPPFVVSIGRYRNLAPEALSSVKPTNSEYGQIGNNTLMSPSGLPNGRYGGVLYGPEEQRVWGIGVSVADGGTTDSASFRRAASLAKFWKLTYNYDRVGGRSADQLHANLEKIVPYGFDPTTGDAQAGAERSYEYYGWERTFTSTAYTTPTAGIMTPPSGATSSIPTVFPSFQTMVSSNPARMNALDMYDEANAGSESDRVHWPSDTGTDRSPAPAMVQQLTDENGDGVPDFVNLLAMTACNETATGSEPFVVLGNADGSFGAGVTLGLSSWAAAIQRQTLLTGTSRTFCGMGMSRPAEVLAPWLSASWMESLRIDMDADGYQDVVRLVGNVPTRADEGLAYEGTSDGWPRWRVFGRDVHGVGVAAPLAFESQPWVDATEVPIRKSPSMTASASATARNTSGASTYVDGYDWNSNELGMLADFTGDGIVDRLAAMRVPYLANNPVSGGTSGGGTSGGGTSGGGTSGGGTSGGGTSGGGTSGGGTSGGGTSGGGTSGGSTSGPPVVKAHWALVLYRGKRALGTPAEGTYAVTFDQTGEYWWTNEAGSDFGLSENDLPPSASESVTTRCYTIGGTDYSYGCEQKSIGASVLADVNGDGLPDLVSAEPVYGRRATMTTGSATLDADVSYTLNPLVVLYNTGRSFQKAAMGGEGVPYFTSYSKTNGASAAEDIRYERSEEMLLDWNGDGLVDMVGPHSVRLGGGGTLSVPLAVSMPAVGSDGFRELVRIASGGEVRTHQHQIVDMNADGRPDLLAVNSPEGATYTLYTDVDMTRAPGRLKKVKNGLGSEVEYKYETIEAALRWEASPADKVPQAGWVVESVTETPGPYWASGPARTTKYTYGKGVFKRTNVGRDDGSFVSNAAGFLGFQTVQAELPTGQKVRTTYEYSDAAFAKYGRVKETETRTSMGELMSRSVHTYGTLSAHNHTFGGTMYQPQDVVLPLSVETETYSESSAWVISTTPVVTRVEYEYPTPAQGGVLAYGGAPRRVLNLGDVDDPEDDIITETAYVQGAFSDTRGTFRVLAPVESWVFGYEPGSASQDVEACGLEISGDYTKVLSHSASRYDCDPSGSGCDAATTSTTLTKGLLAKAIVYKSTSEPCNVGATLSTKYFYGGEDSKLNAVQGPEGRRVGYCYDEKRLYVVASRAPTGARQEAVFDTATGAQVESRGPVGLSTAGYFDGTPLGCADVFTGEPGFDGETPTLPDEWPTPPAGQYDTAPATGTDYPATPPTSEDWEAPEEDPESTVPPYGDQTDSVGAALRTGRYAPYGYSSEAAPYLNLAWTFAYPVDLWAPVLGTGWPTAPMAFESRTLTVPSSHVVYDGLGVPTKTFATTFRQTSGNLDITQMSESSVVFGPGGGTGLAAYAGVWNGTATLVAGDSYGATNAKKSTSLTFADGAGQVQSELATVGNGVTAGATHWYNNRGIPWINIYPHPESSTSTVWTMVGDFDPWGEAHLSMHGGGRTSSGRTAVSFASDGPHYLSWGKSGGMWIASDSDGETEVIPRAHKVISRVYVDSSLTSRMETTSYLDELGRVIKVVSPEGQVTRYQYDLIGRPTFVTRYDSESAESTNTWLEQTVNEYPDNNTSALEVYTQETTSYPETGAPIVASVQTEVDAATGQVKAIRKPVPSGTMSLVGYDDVEMTYHTDSMVDGFLQPSTISSGSEDVSITYNGQQLGTHAERTLHATFPGGGGTFSRTVVYRTEHEATGLLRRTHVDVETGGTSPSTFTEKYTYDEAGHVVSIEDETGGGAPVVTDSFAFNHAGLLVSSTDSQGGTKTLARDIYGQVVSLTVADADLGTAGQVTQTITPDARTGMPTSVATTRPDGTTSTSSYVYNNAGQLTAATNVHGSNTYSFGATYQCASGLCDSRYDHVDETIPGGATRQLRYLYASGYDATQLRTIEDRTTSTPVRSYAYDAVGALTATNGYNYSNDTLGEVWSHEDGGYLYGSSGAQLAQYTKDGAGDPERLYVSLPGLQIQYVKDTSGVFQVDVVERTVGSKRLGVAGSTDNVVVDADLLGNPMTARRGSSVATVAYTPFGEEMPLQTNGWSNEWHGYKGGRNDQTASERVRFGARNYDLFAKRWTSRDPIRTQLAAADSYGAFAANPVVFSDPSGLQSAGNVVRPDHNQTVTAFPDGSTVTITRREQDEETRRLQSGLAADAAMSAHTNELLAQGAADADAAFEASNGRTFLSIEHARRTVANSADQEAYNSGFNSAISANRLAAQDDAVMFLATDGMRPVRSGGGWARVGGARAPVTAPNRTLRSGRSRTPAPRLIVRTGVVAGASNNGFEEYAGGPIQSFGGGPGHWVRRFGFFPSILAERGTPLPASITPIQAHLAEGGGMLVQGTNGVPLRIATAAGLAVAVQENTNHQTGNLLFMGSCNQGWPRIRTYGNAPGMAYVGASLVGPGQPFSGILAPNFAFEPNAANPVGYDGSRWMGWTLVGSAPANVDVQALGQLLGATIRVVPNSP